MILRKAAEQLDSPSRLVSEANQRRRARSYESCSPRPLSLLSGTKVNEVPRAFLFDLGVRNLDQVRFVLFVFQWIGLMT